MFFLGGCGACSVFVRFLGHLEMVELVFWGFEEKMGKCGTIGVVGSVAEWLKAHAWKACERGDSFRRFESSRFRHKKMTLRVFFCGFSDASQGADCFLSDFAHEKRPPWV